MCWYNAWQLLFSLDLLAGLAADNEKVKFVVSDITWPGVLKKLDPVLSVWFIEGVLMTSIKLGFLSSVNLDNPKSVNLIFPSLEMRRLSGLRSL